MVCPITQGDHNNY